MRDDEWKQTKEMPRPVQQRLAAACQVESGVPAPPGAGETMRYPGGEAPLAPPAEKDTIPGVYVRAADNKIIMVESTRPQRPEEPTGEIEG